MVPSLKRFHVGLWLDNGQSGDGPLSAECEALLAEKGIPHYGVQQGQSLDLGRGLLLGVSNDLDGKPRIIFGTVDMGAYEFGFCAFLPVIFRSTEP